MSLAADLAPLAPEWITPEGLALTFTRETASPYDPISNTQAPPDVTTWAAVGMWVENRSRGDATTALSAGTGQRVTRRTLLIPGLGITAPEPGDTVTARGVVYAVGDVERVADTDGATVPLYRVQVTA